MTLDVPTLTGLDSSQPDYVSQLESGLDRLSTLGRETLKTPLPSVTELAAALQEAGIQVEALPTVKCQVGKLLAKLRGE